MNNYFANCDQQDISDHRIQEEDDQKVVKGIFPEQTYTEFKEVQL
ncbi:hypothetical protein [Mesobacillus foraminis]|nr:hypothetical protein [Mesobacillus foraminis]